MFNWGAKRHSVHDDEVTIKGRMTPASGRDESECSDDEFSVSEIFIFYDSVMSFFGGQLYITYNYMQEVFLFSMV